jgi:hypothetical protein
MFLENLYRKMEDRTNIVLFTKDTKRAAPRRGDRGSRMLYRTAAAHPYEAHSTPSPLRRHGPNLHASVSEIFCSQKPENRPVIPAKAGIHAEHIHIVFRRYPGGYKGAASSSKHGFPLSRERRFFPMKGLFGR